VKRGGLLIAGMVVASLVAAQGAAAKTFEVTRTPDTAPNGCNQGGCTLREAIIAANARAGADVVELRSGRTYALEQVGAGEDAAATGDLDITGPTTLRTSKRPRATVDAQALDAAFHVLGPASLTGINIEEGAFGGIRAESVPLTLRRSVVSETVAGSSVEQTGPGGLTVSRVTVPGCPANGIAEDDGGELRATRSEVRDAGNNGFIEFGDGNLVATRVETDGIFNNAIIELDDGDLRATRARTTDTGNNAVIELSFGALDVKRIVARTTGGVALFASEEGPMRVTASKVRGAGDGGVVNDGFGDLFIDRTDVSGAGNSGVSTSSEADDGRITSSTIAGNEGSGGGGIHWQATGTLRLVDSTVTGNLAAQEGGGIFSGDESGSELVVVNSTIAGNEAWGSGGGIYLTDIGAAALNNVTVARNIADADNNASGSGGGLFAGAGAPFQVANSVIAANDQLGGDADDCAGNFESAGGNLRTDGVDCGGFDGPGDAIRANARIGQLRDNGGPTETIALKRGSPAIGRARNATAQNRDQRGQKRDRNPDAGAFER